MEEQHSGYDVLVVGGGAAGLSAPLVLGRARRRVAVIDAGEPRNAPAMHMQGFLSRDGMPPADLLVAGRAEVTRYGVELVEGSVLEIEPGFVVRLADGREHTARRVLVTTGVGDVLPRTTRCARTVGARSPALPLLPRVGSSGPATRRARNPVRFRHLPLRRVRLVPWRDPSVRARHRANWSSRRRH
jgi:NADPH-dependent 2,4-dienoyl-CoA reductase/sulfur reductase-like enzyme